MEDHSDDDIVKVEMQDVYPSSRQAGDFHEDPSASSHHYMDISRGNHFNHQNCQDTISVEQRAAAIMDRIKQLYFIDDDPARKEFLDDYFDFMRKRDATVTRIPTMAKQPLDLYKLYKTVISLGGLTEVVRNRHWSKVTRELSLPASITSAAFTLRTQYLRFLYAYECFQKGIDEQPWKLEDCDDLSNGPFRATQASPSSFVDGRSCMSSRVLSGDQHHSPPWHNEQMMCGALGSRPPFVHSQPQINLHHGAPPARYSQPMEIHCAEFVHHGPKVNHLPNGHVIDTRDHTEVHNHTETNNNECSLNCDCGKNGGHSNSPITSQSISTGSGRLSSEMRSSPKTTRPRSVDLVTSKGSDKSDTSDESRQHQSHPADVSASQPISSDRLQNPSSYSTSIASRPVITPEENTIDIHSECHAVPSDPSKHFCPNTKDEHHVSEVLHDHSIHEQMGRMHFPLTGPMVPANMLQYARGPFCNVRKRPRFYGANEPPRGGCGCKGGEILESTEPMTFKVHYRTEQRVFVTLQFGKRMYLGELFAEELE